MAGSGCAVGKTGTCRLGMSGSRRCLCVGKLLKAVVIIMPLHGLIDVLITPLEGPMKPYPKTELVFVMVVLPTLLTSVWSWVADSLIKGHSGSHDGAAGSPAAGSPAARVLLREDSASPPERKRGSSAVSSPRLSA
mmetsp:Transcript_1287/g.3502  ORF Transcript_1287/g.3502 Transcript_1287/m.3502 type:complete len:136 (+) Transcript_1287:225-632(+)